jgi:hypothetical protein
MDISPVSHETSLMIDSLCACQVTVLHGGDDKHRKWCEGNIVASVDGISSFIFFAPPPPLASIPSFSPSFFLAPVDGISSSARALSPSFLSLSPPCLSFALSPSLPSLSLSVSLPLFHYTHATRTPHTRTHARTNARTHARTHTHTHTHKQARTHARTHAHPTHNTHTTLVV